MGERLNQELFSETEKLQQALETLQAIAEVLKGLNFRVIDDSISLESIADKSASIGFPIVRDGIDGIRASYSPRRGLKIWFTNGFEDPHNPRREAVEQRLAILGLQ